MTAYRFEDSRSGECPVRHLNGYRGVLQVDGYAAYNNLAQPDRGNDGIALAGCWSHSRRKFYELHFAGSSRVATMTVERMAKLWQVEKTVRDQSPDGALPRASKPPRRSSQISSTSGSRPCGGSPAIPNWPRRSATSSRAVLSSNASSAIISCAFTPSTSSNAPASRRGSTGSSGFIGRKGSPSASGGPAARLSAPGSRSLQKPPPMNY